MKTKYTFFIAVALVASQLIGCKATQTSSTIGSFKPNNFSGMGNKNTCSLNHSTKAERKYLANYNYCESLRNSYTQNSQAVIDNNAANAGGAYMLITYTKNHNRVLPVKLSQ